jgi:hypothetical protein
MQHSEIAVDERLQRRSDAPGSPLRSAEERFGLAPATSLAEEVRHIERGIDTRLALFTEGLASGLEARAQDCFRLIELAP